MKKVLVILIVLLSINLFFGYLFQVSNEVVCFTELFVIGGSGLIFWLILYKPLRQFTYQILNRERQFNRQVIAFGGLGLGISLINLVFCQLFVMVVMGLVFNCVSPSFNTLNASLTNNIAGNLLCYTLLIAMIRDQYFQQEELQIIDSKPELLESTPSTILLEHQQGIDRVLLSDISHVEVANNCITIHSSKRKYVRYQSLKSFAEELANSSFARVHRSTLVNLDYVQEIRTNTNGDGSLILTTGIEIRFSRSYKKSFLPAL